MKYKLCWRAYQILNLSTYKKFTSSAKIKRSHSYTLNKTWLDYKKHSYRFCFWTFKFKKQINILKQNRFVFFKELTFNKIIFLSKY